MIDILCAFAGAPERRFVARGACRGTGPDAHYNQEDTGPAKAICAGCPVRLDCLEYALGNDEPDGVWGGLTREQREGIVELRKVSPQASGMVAHCQHCGTVTVVKSPRWPYCSFACGGSGARRR